MFTRAFLSASAMFTHFTGRCLYRNRFARVYYSRIRGRHSSTAMRVVKNSSQPGKPASTVGWNGTSVDAGFPQVLALTDKGALAMQGFPGGRTTLRRCRDSRRCAVA